MSALQANGVTVRFGDRVVLDGVDLAVSEGEWVALVGRNGCGKTTLLRALGGLRAPDAGEVLVRGRALRALSRRQIAREVAVLPQSMPSVPGLTVRQLVRQGRYAVRGPLGMLAGGDDAQVREAMAVTGVESCADELVDRLSGGERQRVRLALALAQDTSILLLDEPTTYLDIGHQLEVLELVRRLQHERGLSVVTVLHDLEQAARFADRVVALRHGAVHTEGPTAEVVDEELLAAVFGVSGRVWLDELTGRPLCTYDSVHAEQ
ncbi:iron complex transport system ATP-binding protein [Saccharopolyspora kobensis]|uniref:Iron complex transport system ATP-binding protein n=3 Tax=Saccharopolyspora kobensis TaxID=146035 RepID=A0A1H6A0R3_9PSEU|nr:ABC transporter ATP-binding protein [Saccharopolyspora kobensis]SEG42309.1 iron complex transport system ATP-binding protein [Saccharopolyspora kobensis]SFE17702.1 iron complex transport system ATP-binding protein [Saccharopolyspora kobensis]